MDIIYIVFFGIIGILIAIGFGLQLSHDIDDFIIYFLFWMLYIISIITFINIILVINYYLTMKNKTGPAGPDGKLGDRGDKGDTGLCDPGCRDKICENQINDAIIQNLKDKNNGLPIKMNNTYIKSKVAQMCRSDEFKQVATNASQDLINYLTSIWTIWIDNIYDAGGLTYFQNIGSENDFEWIKDNPFNELKKYDVFYWGMVGNFRPIIKENCNKTFDGTNPIDNNTHILHSSNTTSYTKICDDHDSGGIASVSFWRANQYTYNGTTYYPIGDIAVGPYRTNDNISKDRYVGINNIGNAIGPNRQTIIVSGDILGPIGYEYIWSNEEDNNNPFWIWEPKPPPGYIALGDVVTIDSDPPLTGDLAPIRCVPSQFATALNSPSPDSTLWSTEGAYASTPLYIYGYTPNDINGTFVDALPQNAYNLFRAISGQRALIPTGDSNRCFYKLSGGSYDSIEIGQDKGTPPINNPRVGAKGGYVNDIQTDAKYSVLSYLKLKNRAILTHSNTKIQFTAQIIPNAISNSYLIKSIDTSSAVTCMSTNGTTVKFSKTCDESKDSQIFSIIFTGNKSNECVLQHYKSGNILKLNNTYSFVPKKTEYETEQLFIMS